jgi:hypothetical protein
MNVYIIGCIFLVYFIGFGGYLGFISKDIYSPEDSASAIMMALVWPISIIIHTSFILGEKLNRKKD